jgi:hypothetical protein
MDRSANTGVQRMSDNAANTNRRANQIRVPAVLVPAGALPGPSLLSTVGSPVRLRVTGTLHTQSDNLSNGQGASQTGNASGQSSGAPASSSDNTTQDDPNIPAGPAGRPSMAPRSVQKGSADPVVPEPYRP